MAAKLVTRKCLLLIQVLVSFLFLVIVPAAFALPLKKVEISDSNQGSKPRRALFRCPHSVYIWRLCFFCYWGFSASQDSSNYRFVRLFIFIYYYFIMLVFFFFFGEKEFYNFSWSWSYWFLVSYLKKTWNCRPKILGGKDPW